MQNIRDLSQFGYRELKEAAHLLSEYIENSHILQGGVSIEFNPSSGCGFLVDEDYNVAMINGEKLERWLSCFSCGEEGFESEVDFESFSLCSVCSEEENEKI